jgi:hypothetical protein
MDGGLGLGRALLLFVVFAFVALVVTGYVRAARARRAHAALMRDGVRGTATVVDNRSIGRAGTDGRSHLSFQAVVVLDGQDGAQPVTLDGHSASAFPVGSRMEVVYDPADPCRVMSVQPPSASWDGGSAVMLWLLPFFAGVGYRGPDNDPRGDDDE